MNHECFLSRCLELAPKGRGQVAPNPMVGAVLVHEGRVIGEGWHEVYGQAHAEVRCFDSVPADRQQLIPESTMYVSLEPCAHHGKTPPCAERIIREGVKKVVIANTDPFEKVAGRGIQLLRGAGVDVTTGILDAEARWLNRRFFCFHEQRRPYIILKWAQSADGYLAPADRSRKQLSNAFSMRLLHRCRTEEAAVMVGTTTALNDDPRLTARLWPGKNPLRIVPDRRLRLPRHLQLFSGEAATWILNESMESEEPNLQYVSLPFDARLLPALLQRLYQAGRQSLIVEGGAALLNSFIRQGLWDEARVFHTSSGIGNGIAAPLLGSGRLFHLLQVGTDELRCWINHTTSFHPVPGTGH